MNVCDKCIHLSTSIYISMIRYMYLKVYVAVVSGESVGI